MKTEQIVIDTNVIVSALRSSKGASHKLVSLIGTGLFEINISVALVLEYEYAAKKSALVSAEHVDNVINYICSVANERHPHFLWRPFLRDPNDDFVLELAVEAGCRFIVTHNLRDFEGSVEFGVKAITPCEFLRKTGVIK